MSQINFETSITQNLCFCHWSWAGLNISRTVPEFRYDDIILHWAIFTFFLVLDKRNVKVYHVSFKLSTAWLLLLCAVINNFLPWAIYFIFFFDFSVQHSFRFIIHLLPLCWNNLSFFIFHHHWLLLHFYHFIKLLFHLFLFFQLSNF